MQFSLEDFSKQSPDNCTSLTHEKTRINFYSFIETETISFRNKNKNKDFLLITKM